MEQLRASVTIDDERNIMFHLLLLQVLWARFQKKQNPPMDLSSYDAIIWFSVVHHYLCQF